MRYKTYNYYQNKKSDVRGGREHKKANERECREHEYIHIILYKHKTKEFTEGGQCH